LYKRTKQLTLKGQHDSRPPASQPASHQPGKGPAARCAWCWKRELVPAWSKQGVAWWGAVTESRHREESKGKKQKGGEKGERRGKSDTENR